MSRCSSFREHGRIRRIGKRETSINIESTNKNENFQQAIVPKESRVFCCDLNFYLLSKVWSCLSKWRPKQRNLHVIFLQPEEAKSHQRKFIYLHIFRTSTLESFTLGLSPVRKRQHDFYGVTVQKKSVLFEVPVTKSLFEYRPLAVSVSQFDFIPDSKMAIRESVY